VRVASRRYFLEVPGGVEAVTRGELKRLGVRGLQPVPGGFRLSGADGAALARASRAATISATYLSLTFDVPRPKALLGDAAFRELVTAVKGVLEGGGFDGLRVSAAGADSPTFTRFAQELSKATGLAHDQEGGELLVRVRPDPEGGWEVLVRLTPRPATTRAWRVCNRPGGLNAAVAAAMNELVGLGADDAYLNLMAGSGTLLIERALRAPARRLVGFDVDPEAVACAEANAAAARAPACEWRLGDVTDAAFMRGLRATTSDYFDALTADAPWGDAVGAHAANRRLYPQILTAAASVARPGARFCLLSHEIKLLRAVVGGQSAWRIERELQVAHGGHNPLVLLLSKAQE